MMKIGILVGSVRRESFTRKITERFVDKLPDHWEISFIKIDDLPIYNQDFDDEGSVPLQWQRFRQEAEGFDAFIFASPEYNRSVPPLLKNAIDIASRPYGQNKWSRKPAMVVAVSPGRLGGFAVYLHLRQILSSLNMRVMGFPEFCVGDAASYINEDGSYSDNIPDELFEQWARSFEKWIANFS